MGTDAGTSPPDQAGVERAEAVRRAVGRIEAAVAALPPDERRAIDELAAELRGDEVSGFGLPGGAGGLGGLGSLSFIVLMQATNDQDGDLSLIMAETKAQANAKQALRNELG